MKHMFSKLWAATQTKIFLNQKRFEVLQAFPVSVTELQMVLHQSLPNVRDAALYAFVLPIRGTCFFPFIKLSLC